MTKARVVILLCAALMLPFSVCHGQSAAAPVAIDTLLTPDIGAIRQVVHIKTDDASKPVLLFLSGGPGSSMMNGAAAFTNKLASRFTIVQWDQRNAGKTLKLNPSPTPPSVAQMADDTVQVIEFLRKELKQDKIYLLGSSWGNVLGFHVVQHRPELLHAYFASNPIVSQLASEKELLATLKRHFKDDSVASGELASVQIPFKVKEDLFYLRKWLFFKEGKKFATSADFKQGFLEWSSVWAPVYQEVMGIDLPATLKSVRCPVHFLVGKNDIQTSTRITTDYYAALQAPKKSLTVFAQSGHQIHQEEADNFQAAILASLPQPVAR